MSRRITASATALLLAAGLGLGMAADAGAGSSLPVTAQASGAGSSTRISAAQAAAIALKQVPGGTVVDIDPGDDNGRAEWKVLVRRPDNTGIEIDLNATTGTVLRQERESLPREAQRSVPAVSVQQAITTAVAAVPRGRVIAIDLDSENGRFVWEAHVDSPGGRVEITIDAASGRILQQKRAD